MKNAGAARRALVTGAAGQDGRYLCELLCSRGVTVFALVHEQDSAPPAVAQVQGDLRNARSLRAAIDQAQPDSIYNLAAATFVPESWTNPGHFRDVNELGVARLLVAIRDSGAPIRFCQASTAEMFGASGVHPLNEDTPLQPLSPYGAAKAAAHRLVRQYREEHNLFACSAILFNHESPLRPPMFVTRKITLAAARIARGLQKGLTLGNLEAARDWGYAPEYVEAMTAMLSAPAPADYVIATGRSCTVREFAEIAFARAGLNWRDHVTSDPALSRPGDAAARIGDPGRIARDLGWRATTTVEQLAAIMVDADLARIDRGET
ncbi:MAG TPA: GDP-mannose 4,6-dehydratase [Candidatus Limnocylindrales bacterium]|nr:GDP-mannose 4,6-dehydratase [Candidatus Limnocylindrales bacterium]